MVATTSYYYILASTCTKNYEYFSVGEQNTNPNRRSRQYFVSGSKKFKTAGFGATYKTRQCKSRGT